MLRSQGWEPGQFLGAKDSAHSEFHTAANASYIRVSLKDDMKGLGYSKSKEDEVTGLDVFSDLLSRLNGKSEAEVEEKQQARLQVKMHAYVEQKWGPMRFVRGGLLVGDVMEGNDEPKDNSDESASETENRKSKSKKRKAESQNDEEDEEDEKKKKKQRKEERKAKKLAKSESAESSDSEKAKKKEKKRDRKEKKEKKKSKKDKALAEKEASEDAAESDDTAENPSSSSNSSSEKVKPKKDKKDKKEKKKEKKDKDKKKKNKDANTPDAEMPDAAPSASRSGTATPISTGTSTPMSRNFVRSRFIAQKRAAFADTQALKQVRFALLFPLSFFPKEKLGLLINQY